MRHILLISLLALGFWACKDDESAKPTGAPANMSFRAVTGGAVMHYTLPSDPRIVGLNVRYRNAFGEDMLRVGSSTCDSVTLIGFSVAQTDIPAQVTLSYHNGEESQPVDVTFDTNDSGPVSFMKTLDCHPNWEGFSLSYEVPSGATGIAHVFYLGTDPVSKLADTILINSFFLEETREPGFASYKMQQDIAAPTVVVRVEDFLGHVVDEKEWKEVDNMPMVKLTTEDFDFYCDNSMEDATYKFGVEYLFDGDTKGVVGFEDNKFHTFFAGPDAVGENAHPMYIDMRDNRLAASVRLYNLFKSNTSYLGWGSYPNCGPVAALGKTYNENELPCEVTVYGLKDNGAAPSSYADVNALEGWVRIGSFKQEKTLPPASRWCVHTWHGTDWTTGTTLASLTTAEPEYMDIVIPVFGQGEGYRFLKMVINDVFNAQYSGVPYDNVNGYVTFHELEVYTD